MGKSFNRLIAAITGIFTVFISCVLISTRERGCEIGYVTAESAIVLKFANNRVLYSKNVDFSIPPASTTKLMTAVIVLENADLEKFVPVSSNAANKEASKLWLKPKVKYKIKDLLAACLMSSANDATAVLAEAISGSEEEFVKLMNKKAKAIGMKNTCFANSTGLPSKGLKQYSNVYDLSQLMRYALAKPLISDLLKTKEKYISGSDGRKLRLLNHNKMLWRRPGYIIGKTGYTIKSRHCFVGTAASDEAKIIFAVLSSKKPWQDLTILVNYGLYHFSRKFKSG